MTFEHLTQALRGLSKLRELPDEARGLLVVSAEGEDPLVGGVRAGAVLGGKGGVAVGEGLSLEGEASGEFVVQQTSRRL